MKKVFYCFNFAVFSILFTACVGFVQNGITDKTYPADIVFLPAAVEGRIFYGNKTERLAENDLNIKIKNGIRYPVSDPLLALSGVTAEKGRLNLFFNPFSGDDGNLKKNKYTVYFTISEIEQKIKQSILIYSDSRGRQYIKQSFKANGIFYTFRNSFSNSFVQFPYMFCEIKKGKNIYEVFAVDKNSVYEKRFLEEGILDENREYFIFSNNILAARFTKTGYTVYLRDSESVLKKSIAVILSIFKFIEESEQNTTPLIKM